jgi:hypothetical protein
MNTIEELQAQLAAKIAKLDEERRANAAKHAKEREEMLLEVETERHIRNLEYTAKVAEHERKKKAEKDEEEAKRIRDVAERVSAEQKQYALDETLRLQREKLEWLEKAISDAEFSEEQHNKEAENARVLVTTSSVEENTIDVEHPVAPDNKGEAVAETGGAESFSTMSQHLKHILRQATRQ